MLGASHIELESSGDGVERRGEWIEGLVGLVRRQMGAVNWGWCRRAGAGCSEDTRVSRGDPAISVGGVTHFRFPTPIEDAILTEPCINTMTYPDIKQQLRVGALWAGGEIGKWGDGGVEAVAGVDRAEIGDFDGGVGVVCVSSHRGITPSS